MGQDKQKARAEEKKAERQRMLDHYVDCENKKQPAFLNGCDGKTTLSRFLDLETWTPKEAACLVSGFDPDTFTDRPDAEGSTPHVWARATSLSGMLLEGYNAILPGDSLQISGAGYEAFDNRRSVLRLWESQNDPPAKVTPAAFIKWCKTKSIATDWLLGAATIENQSAASNSLQNPSNNNCDWMEKAVEVANQIGLSKWNNGEREITQRNIANAVAAELEKDSKYHGTRGPRAASSIRNALIKKKWNFAQPYGTNGTKEN